MTIETISAEVIEAMGRAYDLAPGPRHQTIPEWHKSIAMHALKAAEAMGYVLVPVEATKAMKHATYSAGPLRMVASDNGGYWYDLSDQYAAMIAARPKVP